MNRTSRERLLTQFTRLAEAGHFGADAKSSTDTYAGIPDDLDRAVKFLCDFEAQEVDASLREGRELMTTLILAIYQGAREKDADVADAFANAFITDYPGTRGTSLLDRWTSLAEASYGFKTMAAESKNPSLVWQQTARLILMTNEFLNGLFGLLILAARAALGKRANPNVLNNAFASKKHELAMLTGGEDGLLYPFFRLADPPLRNGIAHGTAWLDVDEGRVVFTDGRREKKEMERDLMLVMAMAQLGTHLAQSYVAAISVILIDASANMLACSRVPSRLLNLLNPKAAASRGSTPDSKS